MPTPTSPRTDPSCPAPYHNSINAGRGRYGQPKCTCAAGVAAYEDYKARSRGQRNPFRGPSHQLAPPTDLPMIDMSRGACVRPGNREIAQAAQPPDGEQGACVPSGALARAKQLCDTCPILNECADYILKAERPAGSWGGVWGGQSPVERRKAGSCLTRR